MPELLTTVEAAKFLGLAPMTLNCWRSRGGGPLFRKLGKRAVRYHLDDLRAFAGQTRRNTSDTQI